MILKYSSKYKQSRTASQILIKNNKERETALLENIIPGNNEKLVSETIMEVDWWNRIKGKETQIST